MQILVQDMYCENRRKKSFQSLCRRTQSSRLSREVGRHFSFFQERYYYLDTPLTFLPISQFSRSNTHFFSAHAKKREAFEKKMVLDAQQI